MLRLYIYTYLAENLAPEREIHSCRGMICSVALRDGHGEIKEKNGVMVAARAKLLIDVLLSLTCQ